VRACVRACVCVNHAAAESAERGGDERVAPLVAIKYPHVLYDDSATWRV